MVPIYGRWGGWGLKTNFTDILGLCIGKKMISFPDILINVLAKYQRNTLAWLLLNYVFTPVFLTADFKGRGVLSQLSFTTSSVPLSKLVLQL